ncbi:ribosome maturation factor [Segetibacter sp. 3557_3]|uniref:ribosome maturation factor RimP n=1 Tax=Segetibacter sp. 3557_3 TaxID=2547429 RepID=UPI001058EEFF|nr:ribosome maturation factor [Segetibacter sp. 3557_3]TDH23987.1 ribosome maturation factor [Segetibacter sp. 3557_3]
MSNETVIQAIEQMIAETLDPSQGDFLVSVRIKPTNNVKVFIDSDGEGGMTIDKCVRYNRNLYKKMEESPLFPDGNFSLEVSSPGLTEPLILHRQYVKNKGRIVEVMFKDGSQKEGTLLEVTENDILLEQTIRKGKKAETHQFVIPFENIKSTTIQIQF